MLSFSPSVSVGAVSVMPLTEAEVATFVSEAWRTGIGGSIVTVNIDILRAATLDSSLADLVTDADIVVADGMPVVWAAAVAGTPVPERVTGASLVGTLAGAAAAGGRSVYLIGGDDGVPDAAADALTAQYPGLVIAGVEAPPYGFEKDPREVTGLVARVAAARPDLVLVGLGFPKQENLITRIRPALPRAWLLGCGAGIPIAAGQFRRAPRAVQRMGGEWLHRLALEPRRLARRYLVDDLPFALQLLVQAVGNRVAGRPLGRDRTGEVAVQPVVEPIPLDRARRRPLPPPADLGA